MAQATARALHTPAPKPRPRKAVTERTAEVILGLFPDVSSGARATHKFFASFLTIISVVGFLLLLVINTLLAQDAFTLSKLKTEAKLVADQKDAINRAIDSYAAPESLAAAAAALGMKPSNTPVFLNLSQPDQSGVTRG
jgi:hypothetical protein